MGTQYHVASFELDHGIRVACSVVEEFNAGIHGGCGTVGLLRANVVEGKEHGVVYSSSIKEEDSYNLLDSRDVLFG